MGSNRSKQMALCVPNKRIGLVISSAWPAGQQKDCALPLPDPQPPCPAPPHPISANVRYRGSTGKAIPSCCHPPDYCRGCDPCDAPSARAAALRKTRDRIARISMEIILAPARGSRLRAIHVAGAPRRQCGQAAHDLEQEFSLKPDQGVFLILKILLKLATSSTCDTTLEVLSSATGLLASLARSFNSINMPKAALSR